MCNNHNHSTRNSAGRLSDFARLNQVVLTASVFVYLLSRFLVVNHAMPGIWRSHGHDFLAMPVLLAFSNLLILATQRTEILLVRLPQVLVLTTLAGAFWEFITPLYLQSTTDPYDLAAYFIGGLCYYAVCRPSNGLTAAHRGSG